MSFYKKGEPDYLIYSLTNSFIHLTPLKRREKKESCNLSPPSPVRLSIMAAVAQRLPPGFHFVPTDYELVSRYLAAKVAGEPFPSTWLLAPPIYDVDIYSDNALEPQQLFSLFQGNGNANGDEEEKDVYFFTQLFDKFETDQNAAAAAANNTRKKRVSASGFWKAQKTTPVVNPRRPKSGAVGFKKVLNFFKEGSSDSWIMHEYVLNTPTPHNSDHRQWAVCRIRRGRPSKTNKTTTPTASSSSSLVALPSPPPPQTPIDSSSAPTPTHSPFESHFVPQPPIDSSSAPTHSPSESHFVPQPMDSCSASTHSSFESHFVRDEATLPTLHYSPTTTHCCVDPTTSYVPCAPTEDQSTFNYEYDDQLPSTSNKRPRLLPPPSPTTVPTDDNNIVGDVSYDFGDDLLPNIDFTLLFQGIFPSDDTSLDDAHSYLPSTSTEPHLPPHECCYAPNTSFSQTQQSAMDHPVSSSVPPPLEPHVTLVASNDVRALAGVMPSSSTLKRRRATSFIT